jgi:hypothetical protein
MGDRHDQRQIHGVEHIDQGLLVNGVMCEEQFVSQQRKDGGRGAVGDDGGTDLASVACIGQCAIERSVN